MTAPRLPSSSSAPGRTGRGSSPRSRGHRTSYFPVANWMVESAAVRWKPLPCQQSRDLSLTLVAAIDNLFPGARSLRWKKVD